MPMKRKDGCFVESFRAQSFKASHPKWGLLNELVGGFPKVIQSTWHRCCHFEHTVSTVPPVSSKNSFGSRICSAPRPPIAAILLSSISARLPRPPGNMKRVYAASACFHIGRSCGYATPSTQLFHPGVLLHLSTAHGSLHDQQLFAEHLRWNVCTQLKSLSIV
jgi:hypothetical protein